MPWKGCGQIFHIGRKNKRYLPVILLFPTAPEDTNPPKIPVLAPNTLKNHAQRGLAWLPCLLIKICQVLIHSRDSGNCHHVASPISTLQQSWRHRSSHLHWHWIPVLSTALGWWWQGMGPKELAHFCWQQGPEQGRAHAAMGLIWEALMGQSVASCPAGGWFFVVQLYVNARPV